MSKYSQTVSGKITEVQLYPQFLTTCKPPFNLEASSDHIRICTKLHIKPLNREEQQPRSQWKKADWEEVNRRLALKLRKLSTGHLELNSPESIDQRVSAITQAIKETIKETIPSARPSAFAKPYWTKECSEAVKEARKARRLWTRLGSEESWVEYQKSTNRKKSQIKKAKMIGWRAIVSEATNDPAKLWKLAKWAKKSPEKRSRLPQLPDIKDKAGNIFTEDTEKADILAQHFFPRPIQANLEDIVGTRYPEQLTTVSSIIIESEIQDAVTETELVMNKWN